MPLGPVADMTEREARRNEVWETAGKLCDTYVELVTTSRQRFAGIETASSSQHPSHDMGCDLELVTWHAGARGRLPSFWPDDESNPTWISVRNIRGTPPVRARNVTARLEFVNSAQTRRLIVPEAVWFEEQHTGHRVSEKYSHAVEIEGGDEQSFIVFSTNKRGDLVPYKNGNEPLEPLGFDHWDVLIHVSSDNVHGHEAHSGFTVTRHSYVHDMPYFIKQLRVPPKVLQQGEQSAE